MCNSLLRTVRNVAYALFASAASDAHGGGAGGGGGGVGGQHWHNERCVACDIRKAEQERDGEGAEAGGSREYEEEGVHLTWVSAWFTSASDWLWFLDRFMG